MIEWRIRIDDDDDHSFSGVYDARLRRIRILRGFEDGLNRVAYNNEASITITRYDIGTSDNELVVAIGRWVRVYASSDGLTWYSVYYGMVDEATVTDSQVTLYCKGRLAYLSERHLPDVHEGKRIDELVQATLERAGMPDKWKASDGTPYGIVGKTSVGNAKVSSRTPFGLVMDESSVVLDYWGDNYGYNALARNVLEDLMLGEWGFLYETGDGQLVFKERRFVLDDREPVATITRSDARALDYRVRTRALTQVIGRVSERYLSENEVIVDQTTVRRVGALRESVFTYQPRQDDDQVMSVKGDLSVNLEFENAFGAPRTLPYWFENMGTRIKLHVQNKTNATGFLQPFTMRGDVIRKQEPSVYEFERSSRYAGGNPLNVIIPSFVSEADITSLATIALKQYNGGAQVRTIELSDTSPLMDDVMGSELYERIDVTPVVGGDTYRQYVIAHEYEFDSGRGRVRLHCAPFINTDRYARVGTGVRSKVGRVEVSF
jgi:hypothetical protein